MTRLKRELAKRGIIYPNTSNYLSDPYGTEAHLVSVTKEFIIVIWYCDVLDPVFRIYSTKNYEFIGEQNESKDSIWGWNSYGFFPFYDESISDFYNSDEEDN